MNMLMLLMDNKCSTSVLPCLMKWRPYFNDIHSEGFSCSCWIMHCDYISMFHCKHVYKQFRRRCNSLPNNEVWTFLRLFHMASSPIFDFDLPAKADKSRLLAEIKQHLIQNSWLSVNNLKTHVTLDYMSTLG